MIRSAAHGHGAGDVRISLEPKCARHLNHLSLHYRILVVIPVEPLIRSQIDLAVVDHNEWTKFSEQRKLTGDGHDLIDTIAKFPFTCSSLVHG